MKSKKTLNRKRIIITIIAYVFVNVTIIGILSVIWRGHILYQRSWERQRSRDGRYLAHIAQALDAYVFGNEGYYLPILDDDTDLMLVLFPDYIPNHNIFICQGAAARYKSKPDDVSMRFRYNITLSGKSWHDLKEGEIVVFEPYWPDQPQVPYFIVRGKGQFDAVLGRNYKITWIPNMEKGWYEQRDYIKIPGVR